MKNLPSDFSTESSSGKAIAFFGLRKQLQCLKALFHLGLLMGSLSFTACNKHSANEQKITAPRETQVEANENTGIIEKEFLNNARGLRFQTLRELLQAHTVTAKSRNFSRAVADGYGDLHVIMPNMGYYFMKSPIVNSTFEIRNPEIFRN